MLWNKITDFKLPMRFQIPRGYCEYGKSQQFNLIHIRMNDDEFLEWFKNLENTLIGPDKTPIDSRVRIDDKTIHVKYVDDFTQVFDTHDTFLIDGVKTFANCNLDCLVEIDKVYGPLGENKSYGVTCKIFQVRVMPNEPTCLFE